MGLVSDHHNKVSIIIKVNHNLFAGGESCFQFVKTQRFKAQKTEVQWEEVNVSMPTSMNTIWKYVSYLKFHMIATDKNITILIMWELEAYLRAWIWPLIRIKYYSYTWFCWFTIIWITAQQEKSNSLCFLQRGNYSGIWYNICKKSGALTDILIQNVRHNNLFSHSIKCLSMSIAFT